MKKNTIIIWLVLSITLAMSLLTCNIVDSSDSNDPIIADVKLAIFATASNLGSKVISIVDGGNLLSIEFNKTVATIAHNKFIIKTGAKGAEVANEVTASAFGKDSTGAEAKNIVVLTLTRTVDEGESLSIALLAGAVTDDAGNTNDATTEARVVTVDNVKPALKATNSIAATAGTNTVAVTFTEDIILVRNMDNLGDTPATYYSVSTGVTDNLSPNALTAISASGAVVTFTLTNNIEAGQEVSLKIGADAIADLAGNTNADTGTLSYKIPSGEKGPTIFATASNLGSKVISIVDGSKLLSIEFDKAVDTVAHSKFIIKTGAKGAEVANEVTASAFGKDNTGAEAKNIVVLTLTRTVDEGESLSIALLAGAVTDDAGNTNDATIEARVVTVDNVKPAPKATNSIAATAGTNTVAVTFAEDVTLVRNMDNLGDTPATYYSVSTGVTDNLSPNALTAISASGAVVTFTLTNNIEAGQEVSLKIGADAIADLAGNTNADTGTLNYILFKTSTAVQVLAANEIRMHYTEDVDFSKLLPTGEDEVPISTFTVNNGANITIRSTSVNINLRIIDLKLQEPLALGDLVHVTTNTAIYALLDGTELVASGTKESTHYVFQITDRYGNIVTGEKEYTIYENGSAISRKLDSNVSDPNISLNNDAYFNVAIDSDNTSSLDLSPNTAGSANLVLKSSAAIDAMEITIPIKVVMGDIPVTGIVIKKDGNVLPLAQNPSVPGTYVDRLKHNITQQYTIEVSPSNATVKDMLWGMQNLLSPPKSIAVSNDGTIQTISVDSNATIIVLSTIYGEVTNTGSVAAAAFIDISVDGTKPAIQTTDSIAVTAGTNTVAVTFAEDITLVRNMDNLGDTPTTYYSFSTGATSSLSPNAITAISASGAVVTFTLTNNIEAGQEISWKIGADAIADLAGNANVDTGTQTYTVPNQTTSTFAPSSNYADRTELHLWFVDREVSFAVDSADAFSKLTFEAGADNNNLADFKSNIAETNICIKITNGTSSFDIKYASTCSGRPGALPAEIKVVRVAFPAGVFKDSDGALSVAIDETITLQ